MPSNYFRHHPRTLLVLLGAVVVMFTHLVYQAITDHAVQGFMSGPYYERTQPVLYWSWVVFWGSFAVAGVLRIVRHVHRLLCGAAPNTGSGPKGPRPR